MAPTSAPEPRDSSAAGQSRRLQALDALLPALAGVLDVREVFSRVSEIAQQVLPHDMVALPLISADRQSVQAYAAFDAAAQLSRSPEAVPLSPAHRALFDGGWDYLIVDDVLEDPLERDTIPATLGLRSILRLAVHFQGAVVGVLDFGSFTPSFYTPADALIGRRITDHIAMALSHQRLAEEARRSEDLRSRAASLELLDELLAATSDGGDLPQVFDRISAISAKVLPHDALFLPVFLPDGLHARRYVSSGLDVSQVSEIIEIPEALRDPNCEYEILDDLAVNPTPATEIAVRMGFRSAIRLPVRLDGRIVAGLGFLSRTLRAYTADDVPIARRIADRIAVSLARERGLEAVRRADEATARAARLEARVRNLMQELDARTGYRRVVGESAAWRQVLMQATQVASTETTVLLLGESGTGKEVVARLLHRASPRRDNPFVALNCAALPEQLLEAELFGYERGAFTGAAQSKPGQLEQASGGVLFLDEVGEMSLPAQAKFLRVLQEREFQRLGGTRVLRTDARIVAATNRDLQVAMAQGLFREDLFYRLNVFAIRLPPLRERREDILPLSDAFVRELGRAFGNPPAGISREAKQTLLDYHWPGKVRELRNILERAAILCDGGLITSDHLALTVGGSRSIAAPQAAAVQSQTASPAAAAPPAASAPATPREDLKSMERMMIQEALQVTRFNKSKAAKHLGLSRHQLYVRMRRHGLE